MRNEVVLPKPVVLGVAVETVVVVMVEVISGQNCHNCRHLQ
jgi:hypothetical protein